MTRFQQILEPADDAQLAALYQEIVDGGFGTTVPHNWFTAQSTRPDILAATWSLVRSMVGGILPSTIKQMIMLAISIDNDCHYCRVVHARALGALDVPRELIDHMTTDLNLAKFPPHQRAVLQFALKAAREPHGLTDTDFQILRDFGLADGEIMEVALMAAFTNFINTWADASGIEVDDDEHSR